MDKKSKVVIEGAWDEGVPKTISSKVIHNKLDRCKRDMIKWSLWKDRDHESDLAKMIEELRQELLVEGPYNATTIRDLKDKLGLLFEKEDIKWKQRTKRTWFLHGDKNTKYFHAYASQKRKKN